MSLVYPYGCKALDWDQREPVTCPREYPDFTGLFWGMVNKFTIPCQTVWQNWVSIFNFLVDWVKIRFVNCKTGSVAYGAWPDEGNNEIRATWDAPVAQGLTEVFLAVRQSKSIGGVEQPSGAEAPDLPF